MQESFNRKAFTEEQRRFLRYERLAVIAYAIFLIVILALDFNILNLALCIIPLLIVFVICKSKYKIITTTCMDGELVRATVIERNQSKFLRIDPHVNGNWFRVRLDSSTQNDSNIIRVAPEYLVPKIGEEIWVLHHNPKPKHTLLLPNQLSKKSGFGHSSKDRFIIIILLLSLLYLGLYLL